VSVAGVAYTSGQLIEDQLESLQIPLNYSQLHQNPTSNAQIISMIDSIVGWLHYRSPMGEAASNNDPNNRKLSLSAPTLFGQSEHGMCRYEDDGRIGQFIQLIVDRLVEVISSQKMLNQICIVIQLFKSARTKCSYVLKMEYFWGLDASFEDSGFYPLKRGFEQRNFHTGELISLYNIHSADRFLNNKFIVLCRSSLMPQK
jgi:hypothetical protein